jgi:hypothetical protein
MSEVPDDFVKGSLRQRLEGTLDEKVKRWQRIKVHQIIPYDFFAAASSECRDMFADYKTRQFLSSCDRNIGNWAVRQPLRRQLS